MEHCKGEIKTNYMLGKTYSPSKKSTFTTVDHGLTMKMLVFESILQIFMIRNVLKRRRECGTYLATACRHRRRLKMQKRDE